MPIKSLILVAGLLAFSLSLWAQDQPGVYDPGKVRSGSYPDKQVKDPKGDGRVSRYDEGRGTHADYDPGSERTTGYPDASITVIRGDGKATRFDDGEVQYPSEYKNPSDSKPLEPKNRDQELNEKAGWPLPSGCLLRDGKARDLTHEILRDRRKEVNFALVLSDRIAAVQSRDRSWKSPGVIGGGYKLLGTNYHPKDKSWTARLYIPFGSVCPEGEYEIRQDDALASGAMVLDIRDGLVLMLVEGQLGYLRGEGLPSLAWRMAWDSGIEVEYIKGKGDTKTDKKEKGGKSKPDKKAATKKK